MVMFPINTNGIFCIQKFPGKGRGLVAVDKIEMGTRIFIEKAIFIVVANEHNFCDAITEEIINHKLSCIPIQERVAFFTLQNNSSKEYPHLGKYKSNALPLSSGSPDGGMFLTAALINHDCMPNSQPTWNPSTQSLTVHALRDIAKGEEITIAYLSGTYEFRQTQLQKLYKFDCTCEHCSIPVEQRRISDQRMNELQKLGNWIECFDCMIYYPHKSLQLAFLCWRILTKQGINDNRIPAVYHAAFQITTAHSDLARATVFAQMCYHSNKICEGDDSDGTVALKAMAESPSNHHLYGRTTIWASTPAMIPTNLNALEFHHWLWRYAEDLGVDPTSLPCRLFWSV